MASVAVALYLAACVLAAQCRGRTALALVLGFSALFAVTLLLTYPQSSPDIFNYVIDGRMAWLYGLNPMTNPRLAVAGDPLWSAQHCCAQLVSPYGPVWQLLLFIPTRLAGNGFVGNTIAFRAISVPFVVGSAYLAAKVAEARAPRYAPAAALLVGWSPLILWETASNGHNDMVSGALALFAIERAMRGRWTAALPILTLSILTKYWTLMFVPLVLIAVLRGENRRWLRALLPGALLSAGLALVLIAPFWSGPATFGNLFSNQLNIFGWSPAWLLGALLHGNAPLSIEISATRAGDSAKLVTLALFAVIYAVLLLRLWNRRDSLLTSCFYCLFFYLLVAAWYFVPWYAGILVVLSAGLTPSRETQLAGVFSVTSLYSHVVLNWSGDLVNLGTSVALPMAAVAVVFIPTFCFWLAGLPRPDWLASAFGEPASPPRT